VARRARHTAARSVVLRHQRAHARTPVDHQRGACRAAARRRSSRRPPTVRASSAAPRPRGRDGPRGRAADRHPAPARAQQPRDHLGLSTGHRQRRNHRNGPLPPRPDDSGQRVVAKLAAGDAWSPASGARSGSAALRWHAEGALGGRHGGSGCESFLDRTELPATAGQPTRRSRRETEPLLGSGLCPIANRLVGALEAPRWSARAPSALLRASPSRSWRRVRELPRAVRWWRT
jgi:hypothetical protein